MLFTRAILAGEPIKVFNHGRMRRDFTYVDDIVEGVVRVLGAPPGDAAGRAVRDLQHRQSRGGRARDVHRDARAPARPAGASSDYLPMQPGDVPATYASIDRLRALDRLRAAHAARRRASRASSPGIADYLPRERGAPPGAGRAGAACSMAKIAGSIPARAVPAHVRDASRPHSMILVTGGAGFIGANFVRDWLAADRRAGRQPRQAHLRRQPRQPRGAARTTPRHAFVRGDIGDRGAGRARCCAQHRPRAIVNFAAESHVDRSIDGPADVRRDQRRRHVPRCSRRRARYWAALPAAERASAFRFLHVSTDEVYGSLGPDDPPFTETTPYAPNSPYSASKAAADHLVRAYHHTYGLPTLTTNCSNNYGPLPVPREADPADDPQRARGQAAAGLRRRPATCATGSTSTTTARRSARCSRRAGPGETYNIGGNAEMTNLDVVHDDLRDRSHELRAAAGGYAALDHLRHGPARATTAATRSTRRKIRARARLDAARRPSRPGCARTVRWYLDNARVGRAA